MLALMLKKYQISMDQLGSIHEVGVTNADPQV